MVSEEAERGTQTVGVQCAQWPLPSAKIQLIFVLILYPSILLNFISCFISSNSFECELIFSLYKMLSVNRELEA